MADPSRSTGATVAGPRAGDAPASNDAQVRHALKDFTRVADVPTEFNWMMTKARRLGEGGFDAMWARPWRWLHAFVEVAAWAGGYHIVASSQSIGQRCSARVKAPSNSSRSSSSERAWFMSGYPPSPSFRTTSSSLKTSPGRSQGVCHAGARVNALRHRKMGSPPWTLELRTTPGVSMR